MYLIFLLIVLVIVVTFVYVIFTCLKVKQRKVLLKILGVLGIVAMGNIVYYIVMSNHVIGVTECAEWLTITTKDGRVYEIEDGTGITIADKGHLLGTVYSPCVDISVMRVYSVKGDKERNYLYTFHGYKGQIYKLKD